MPGRAYSSRNKREANCWLMTEKGGTSRQWHVTSSAWNQFILLLKDFRCAQKSDELHKGK